MKSQLIEYTSGLFLKPFPKAKSQVFSLGISPVKPGFYGHHWSETILLTTNFRPTLEKIGQTPTLSLTVLALDAGGFTPEAAAALDAVSFAQVDKIVNDMEEQTSFHHGNILVPHVLASRFGWVDGTQLGTWKMQVVPGELKKLISFLERNQPSDPLSERLMPAFIQRLLIGLILLGWQTLILAIPLLIFGWQSLVKGLAALLVSTIVLALTWRIIPSRGWVKGLIAGVALAFTLIMILLLVFNVNTYIYPAIGLFLSCFWMSIVFSGVKY